MLQAIFFPPLPPPLPPSKNADIQKVFFPKDAAMVSYGKEEVLQCCGENSTSSPLFLTAQVFFPPKNYKRNVKLFSEQR